MSSPLWWLIFTYLLQGTVTPSGEVFLSNGAERICYTQNSPVFATSKALCVGMSYNHAQCFDLIDNPSVLERTKGFVCVRYTKRTVCYSPIL